VVPPATACPLDSSTFRCGGVAAPSIFEMAGVRAVHKGTAGAPDVAGAKTVHCGPVPRPAEHIAEREAAADTVKRSTASAISGVVALVRYRS
jgi:hypothetical protein